MTEVETTSTKGNSRVSNALLKQRVEYLIDQVRDWHAEQREWNDKMEIRVRCLEGHKTETRTLWKVLGGGTGVGIITAIIALVKAFLG